MPFSSGFPWTWSTQPPLHSSHDCSAEVLLPFEGIGDGFFLGEYKYDSIISHRDARERLISEGTLPSPRDEYQTARRGSLGAAQGILRLIHSCPFHYITIPKTKRIVSLKDASTTLRVQLRKFNTVVCSQGPGTEENLLSTLSEGFFSSNTGQLGLLSLRFN